MGFRDLQTRRLKSALPAVTGGGPRPVDTVATRVFRIDATRP